MASTFPAGAEDGSAVSRQAECVPGSYLSSGGADCPLQCPGARAPRLRPLAHWLALRCPGHFCSRNLQKPGSSQRREVPCEKGGEDGVSFSLPRASARPSCVPGEVGAPVMGLEPRPHRALSKDWGPARSPVGPATPAALPSVSRTSSASSCSVAPLVWRLHVASLGPEPSGRE